MYYSVMCLVVPNAVCKGVFSVKSSVVCIVVCNVSSDVYCV